DPAGALRAAVVRNLPSAGGDPDPVAVAGPITGGGASGGGASGDGAPSDARPDSRSVAEPGFATREGLVSGAARLDPRLAWAASVHALHVGRVLCVPVHARGRVAGVLYLEARTGLRPLGDDDLRLLLAFGDQAAVVLDSARLTAENARRAD